MDEKEQKDLLSNMSKTKPRAIHCESPTLAILGSNFRSVEKHWLKHTGQHVSRKRLADKRPELRRTQKAGKKSSNYKATAHRVVWELAEPPGARK